MDNLHPVKRVQAGQPMQVLLAASLLVAALLTNVVRVPTTAGYIATSLLTATLAVVWLRTTPDSIPRDTTTIGLLGVIAGLFIAGLIVNGVTASRVARTIIFISATPILVLITPRLIGQDSFNMVFSRLAGALFAIAAVVRITETYTTLAVSRPGWYWSTPLPGLPFRLLPWVGVLNSPNLMGVVCVFGAFTALADYYRTRSAHAALLAVVLGAGTIVTTSRASLLALIAGLGVLAAHHFRGTRGVAATVAAGGITAAIGIAIVVHPSAGSSVLHQIGLAGRGTLWRGAWDATLARPVVGWGATDTADVIARYIESSELSGRAAHNSYLRVGVMAGIPGLVAYVCICVLALSRAVKAVTGRQSAAMVALVVSMLVFQAFNSATIYGLSFRSVLYALVIGYSLTTVR